MSENEQGNGGESITREMARTIAAQTGKDFDTVFALLVAARRLKAEQLVRELRDACGAMRGAIVVRFETQAEAVSTDMPDAARRLDAMIARGGVPVGMVGLTPGAGAFTRPLEQFASQPWAEQYLNDYLKSAFNYLGVTGKPRQQN